MKNKKEVSKALTLGQKRVGAEYNAEKDKAADKIKNFAGLIIDHMEDSRYNGTSDSAYIHKHVEGLRLEADNARGAMFTEEKARLVIIMKRNLDFAYGAYIGGIGDAGLSETSIDNAQTSIETACMYALKSLEVE